MGIEYLGNFLGGLDQNLSASRAQAREDQAKQDERDHALFTALANSDDPDIRAAAVTGLLTGKPPAKFMDKFIGKMQEHPAYEQIRGLVANGHQPYPGQTEQTRRTTKAQTQGQITGRLEGAFGAAQEAGAPLTNEQKQRATMGALGAASSLRAAAKQKVIIHRKGGEVTGGYFDPETGGFFGDDGQTIDDVEYYENARNTSAARTGSTGVGAKWQSMSMKQYRSMFGAAADLSQYADIPDGASIQARISADGSEASAPVLISPPPQNPNFTGIQTNEGIAAFNTHTGSANLAAGGVGLTPPTAPATSAGALREIQNGILRMHPTPKNAIGGPPSPADVAKWKQALDQEAQRYQFPTFAALQAAIGDETSMVQQAVPTGAPPEPPPAGGGAARPARPVRGGRSATPAGPANDPLGILQHLPR